VMTAIIRCGENSLAIYCLGVLLSFIGHVVLTKFLDTIAMQAAVSIGGIVLMSMAATLMTWEAKLDRRGPKLF
jgi:OpgC protein